MDGLPHCFGLCGITLETRTVISYYVYDDSTPEVNPTLLAQFRFNIFTSATIDDGSGAAFVSFSTTGVV